MLYLRFVLLCAVLFAVMFGLSGCAVDRTYGAAPGIERVGVPAVDEDGVGSGDIEVTDLRELPVPASGGGFGLRSYDEVEVRVLQDDRLNGVYRVDDAGMIDFPYIGMIRARGLSARQFQDALADRLSPGYVRNPEIVVRPTDMSLQTVSLGGEINSPGNYPVQASPTLMRAINTAGGTAQFAQLDDVLIFREVADVKYIGLYNMEAIRRGNYPDPALVPGDVVMIGYSPARQRLETIFQYVPLLTTSLVLIDRFGR